MGIDTLPRCRFFIIVWIVANPADHQRKGYQRCRVRQDPPAWRDVALAVKTGNVPLALSGEGRRDERADNRHARRWQIVNVQFAGISRSRILARPRLRPPVIDAVSIRGSQTHSQTGLGPRLYI